MKIVKTDINDLCLATATFEKMLPGWWWSIGQCGVGGHASCGPDREGPDSHLLEQDLFDEGFHSDTEGGSPSEALKNVMMSALEAKREFKPSN